MVLLFQRKNFLYQLHMNLWESKIVSIYLPYFVDYSLDFVVKLFIFNLLYRFKMVKLKLTFVIKSPHPG